VVILFLWHFFLYFQTHFLWLCVNLLSIFYFFFTFNHHINYFLNLFFYNLLLPNLNINTPLLKYTCSPILRQGKSSCFSFLRFKGSKQTKF
jgi:hypothetical protein